MEYSQKTQELIERQCRNVERSDFILNKPLAENLILQTYNLFNLKRPSKIVWCKDIFDEPFVGSARSARSAGSAGSAWLAIDYDFDLYVFEFEYCQNPNKKLLPNKNDYIYLEYCELLMQAKEAGLGYRVELEDTLYLVPTPIVKINKLNQFHSTNSPAIRWKDGKEFYFINGVNFSEYLFKTITSDSVTAKDILSIEDIDQRTQAMRFLPAEDMVKELKGELLDEYNKFDIEANPVNYKLYRFPKGEIFTEDAYYCLFDCPSTRKKHMEGVEVSKTVPEAMAWAEEISPEEWKLRVPLVDEV